MFAYTTIIPQGFTIHKNYVKASRLEAIEFKGEFINFTNECLAFVYRMVLPAAMAETLLPKVKMECVIYL